MNPSKTMEISNNSNLSQRGTTGIFNTSHNKIEMK